MRWFTDAAYEADDDVWDRTLAEYFAYVREIEPSLPPDLARLALTPELNLHDARFEAVDIDLDADTVAIVVIAGNLQAGYRRLSMQFSGARIVPDNLQRLGYAVRAEFKQSHWSRHRTVTEILAQEVDVAGDGRYVLRLRLWPFHEFAIEFDGMSLTEESVADRGPARAGSFDIRGTRDYD